MNGILIHRRTSSTPSVKNILQGLQGVDSINTLDVLQLTKENNSKSTLRHYLRYSSVYSRALKNYNTLPKYDFVILHKVLSLLDTGLLEYFYTRADNVIYSTYDSEYIKYPRSCSILFRNSDHVLATSKKIYGKANEYKDEKSVSYIPPSVDTNFFKPLNVSSKAKKDELVIGWVGNAKEHQEDIILFYDNFDPVEFEKQVVVRLLGGGQIPPKLENKISEVDVNTDVVPFVPWERVPEIINTFNIGIAPLADTEFNRGRSSEKIREYMACGVPVVASDVGENSILIPKNTGLIVQNENQWTTGLKEMATKHNCKDAGMEAREHALRHYSIESISEKMEHEIFARIDHQ